MRRRPGTYGVLLLLAAGVAGCIGATKPAATTPQSTTTSAPARETRPVDAAPCDALELDVGRLRISQRWIIAKQKCIVMVSGDDNAGKARSYLFNSQGMLMTFSVLGKGPDSRATGARTHLLLPNVHELRVDRDGTKVLVHTTSGHVVTFDGASGQPEGMSDGEFRVEKTAGARDGGGVTLRTSKGIVVDFGFKRGGSPHEDPEGSATLTDGRGEECTVKNSDLLSFEDSEPKPVVSSAQDLSAFLAAAHCGMLHVGAP